MRNGGEKESGESTHQSNSDLGRKTMKKLASVFALLFLLIPSSASGARLGADAKVTSVVVYPDRALVTRTAELELATGEHAVVFGNLPTSINADSLRTRGEGDADVRIYSIDSRKVVLEEPREEQIARLEAQIQAVRDEIAGAEARANNLAAERELVRSIGVYSGEQFSKEFITREPSPDEWRSMVEFQRENLARVSEDMLETEIRKRELNRRLDALMRELNELRGRSERAALEVTVTLAARSSGRFALSLSSVIRGAGWYPSYDARADVRHEKVEIHYIGNVRQNTGEDWNNVEVFLSTARPAVGAKMPELRPWYLRPQEPIARGAERRADRALMLEERKAAVPAVPAKPAEMAMAEIIQRGTSVQFKAPKRMDIPSDNAYHRAMILAKEIPAELSYAATPKLSPFAYLTAKLTNTTGAQWLAGKVSVFVDGDFIGTSRMEAVAAGEEIDLDLGIDEAIKVEREQLVRKEDEKGIVGKKKEHRFKDKITLENLKDKAIKLALIDQAPVSQHDDIEVKDIKFSEKPTERDPDTGILKWELELAPKQKKEIILEFTVLYPLDMPVFGL